MKVTRARCCVCKVTPARQDTRLNLEHHKTAAYALSILSVLSHTLDRLAPYVDWITDIVDQVTGLKNAIVRNNVCKIL